MCVALQSCSSIDYGFLERYCHDVIIMQYTPAEKRSVVKQFVTIFSAGGMTSPQAEKILQVRFFLWCPHPAFSHVSRTGSAEGVCLDPP